MKQSPTPREIAEDLKRACAAIRELAKPSTGHELRGSSLVLVEGMEARADALLADRAARPVTVTDEMERKDD